MPHYRVQFQGYIEAEFDDEQAARDAFMDVMSETEDYELFVEEWDEDSMEWT